MNIYHRLLSLFYPKFLEQFNQKVISNTSKVNINMSSRSINFESTLRIRPSSDQKVVHFLLSSDCELYEVTYLGLPLNFKTKMVKFYNNQQLIILELPIKPSGNVDVNITFKYYCYQSTHLSFNKDSILLNNKGGLFPYIPTSSTYPCDISLTIPQGWHIVSGLKEDKKKLKFDGQHLVLKGNSYSLSFVIASSLKTSDTLESSKLNVVYPRPYLNQARTIVNLAKQLVTYYCNQYGHITNSTLNIAIIPGKFEKYFDGSNIVFSTAWLDSIKENGKTPKDREKMIFTDLAQLIGDFWWDDIMLSNPDEVWLKEGISHYTALLAVKNFYDNDSFLYEIEQLQKIYVDSPGYGQGLSLLNASYGLGKSLDLCSPLNILLVHTLSFLCDGCFNEILRSVKQWDSLEWSKIITHIKDTYSIDLDWLTQSYVKKHRKANLSLSRLEVEQNSVKGTLLDVDRVWRGPVELRLVSQDRQLYFTWDGLSPIQTSKSIESVVLDPNLYIPGNITAKQYQLDSNTQEKVGT